MTLLLATVALLFVSNVNGATTSTFTKNTYSQVKEADEVRLAVESSETKQTRPDWANPVKIDLEIKDGFSYDEKAEKPQIIKGNIWITSIEGVVLPTKTTGRAKPRVPINGFPTGGDTGFDSGHLFALSLGGPNIRGNIVPQQSKWQEHGEWRHLERYVEYLAKKKMGMTDSFNLKVDEDRHLGIHPQEKWNTQPSEIVKFRVNTHYKDYDVSGTGAPIKYTGNIETIQDIGGGKTNIYIYAFEIEPQPNDAKQKKEAIWVEHTGRREGQDVQPPEWETFIKQLVKVVKSPSKKRKINKIITATDDDPLESETLILPPGLGSSLIVKLDIPSLLISYLVMILIGVCIGIGAVNMKEYVNRG